jgi:hypothetical protein
VINFENYKDDKIVLESFIKLILTQEKNLYYLEDKRELYASSDRKKSEILQEKQIKHLNIENAKINFLCFNFKKALK